MIEEGVMYHSYFEVLPKRLHMFGGGSSGSSGSTGTHDWPTYMKEEHNKMLYDVYNLVQTAGATIPETYTYDPRVWFGYPTGYSAYGALALFGSFDVPTTLDAIVADPNFNLSAADMDNLRLKAAALRTELMDGTPYTTAVGEIIDAHAAKLLAKVNADIIPKIEVGMRDLNAVIGSSFVIAKEIALEDYTEEVSDFTAKMHIRFWELRHELYKAAEEGWIQAKLRASELNLKYTALCMEKIKLQVSMAAELANAAFLSQSKYGVISTEKEIRDRSWKLDLYDHMNKTMASISGASPVSSKADQSTASAMFTGGLSMAAMGAGVGGYLAGGASSTFGASVLGAESGLVGGPAGAILGGVIGLGVGLIGGLLKK